MKIIYFSLTGNVRRFIAKSDFEGTPIEAVKEMDEPYLLVTSTIGFGEVPDPVAAFLAQHHDQLVAVVSSGNRNWGNNFARAGDRIAEKYKVPLLMKFELHGNQNDVALFNEKVEKLYENFGREKIQSY